MNTRITNSNTTSSTRIASMSSPSLSRRTIDSSRTATAIPVVTTTTADSAVVTKSMIRLSQIQQDTHMKMTDLSKKKTLLEQNLNRLRSLTRVIEDENWMFQDSSVVMDNRGDLDNHYT